MVNCGGHFDYNCRTCPGGNGAAWCNGDCTWVELTPGWLGEERGECVERLLNAPGQEAADIYYWLTSFLVSGIIMFIFACFYKQRVISGRPELPKVGPIGTGPARRGLFDCFWHPDTCLYVTFCLPVVAGKNYYAAGMCSFWTGCICTFLGTYSPFYCLTACIRAMLAGTVQEKLSTRREPIWNCFTALFCFPCAIGQESLEVDAEIGADITCCCNLHLTPRPIAEVENAIEKTEQRMCGRGYRVCGGEGH